jgi:hypothetical protein
MVSGMGKIYSSTEFFEFAKAISSRGRDLKLINWNAIMVLKDENNTHFNYLHCQPADVEN